MQKKIIALAVAGLVSGGAFAQSNVTISGQFKEYVQSMSFSGCTNYVGAATSCSTNTNRASINNGTSFVRLAGEEALGNGTSTWWQIEQDFNGNTTGAAWANRNTGVGLKGAWGMTLMGHWDVHYTSHATVGLNGLDEAPLTSNVLNIIGQTPTGIANSIGANAVNTQGSTFGGARFDNVIAYITPDFSGFKAMFGYTFLGANTTNQPGLTKKDGAWTLKLNYDNGPINAMWSHVDVLNSNSNVAGGSTGANVYNGITLVGGVQTAAAITSTAASGTIGGAAAANAAFLNRGVNGHMDRLGAAYSFPMGLKIGLIFDANQYKDTASGVTIGKRSAWALPVTYTTGAHKFGFDYARAGNSTMGDASTAVAGNLTGSTTLGSSGAKMWNVDYVYSMSKRTKLVAAYSRINNDSNANYDYWTRGSATAGASNTALGESLGLVSVGMFHSF